MHLTIERCRELLDELSYQRDDRNPPDERRRGRFRAGWVDAAEKGRVYEPKSKQTLTWSNLGNRLGVLFGRASVPDIDETFDCFALEYRASHLS